jgi:hypothetical protein
MPVDVVSRTTASNSSRLSSFGFSGTIAHGAFEARKTVSIPTDAKSLYRNKILTRSEHQYSLMRRLALARDQTKVNISEETHTVCCRELVTVADHWRAQTISYLGNQTCVADEIESQHVSCSPQFNEINACNGLQIMRVNQEVRFALPENSLEPLQIELANSLCNVDAVMLRRAVFPELAYAPFPQKSISKLELVSNLHQPQSTLVLSTGEANLGAHNFSNEIRPSTVFEAEAQATRLLGQNVRCIQLPMDTLSTPMETDSAVLGRLLDYTSLEVGHKIVSLSFV